jgi:ABC-type sulfate transport system permease subunit
MVKNKTFGALQLIDTLLAELALLLIWFTVVLVSDPWFGDPLQNMVLTAPVGLLCMLRLPALVAKHDALQFATRLKERPSQFLRWVALTVLMECVLVVGWAAFGIAGAYAWEVFQFSGETYIPLIFSMPLAAAVAIGLPFLNWFYPGIWSRLAIEFFSTLKN